LVDTLVSLIHQLEHYFAHVPDGSAEVDGGTTIFEGWGLELLLGES
jgi:hypothetical protein